MDIKYLISFLLACYSLSYADSQKMNPFISSTGNEDDFINLYGPCEPVSVTTFFDDIADNNLEAVKKFITKQKDLITPEVLKSALKVAVKDGNSKILEYLVDLDGIDLSSLYSSRRMILHIAILEKQPACLFILMRSRHMNKEYLKNKDEAGRTPLQLAEKLFEQSDYTFDGLDKTKFKECIEILKEYNSFCCCF